MRGTGNVRFVHLNFDQLEAKATRLFSLILLGFQKRQPTSIDRRRKSPTIGLSL